MHNIIKISDIVNIRNAFLVRFLLFSFLLLGISLYFALIGSPIDYVQGNAVRIMYIHVPSAWLALLVYSVIAIICFFAFIYKSPLLFIHGISLAPIGASFAFITLITGSLWGRPIWGTWWVWDARLTSMLILFLLYLAYIALYKMHDNILLGAKSAAILGMVGFINIPIIKFSVELWNSLHQKASIFRKSGIALDSAMLLPLLMMFFSLIILTFVIYLMRFKIIIQKQKLSRMQID